MEEKEIEQPNQKSIMNSGTEKLAEERDNLLRRAMKLKRSLEYREKISRSLTKNLRDNQIIVKINSGGNIQ